MTSPFVRSPPKRDGLTRVGRAYALMYDLARRPLITGALALACCTLSYVCMLSIVRTPASIDALLMAFAHVFAWTSTILALVSLAAVTLRWINQVKAHQLHTANPWSVPGRFMKTLPDFAVAYAPLRDGVLIGTLNPNDAAVRKSVSSLAEEWDVFKRQYTRHRRLKLLKEVFVTALAIVVLFACLYLTDYVIMGASEFGGASMPNGNPVDWLVEALYYSVVTFATLGYGDIRPGPRPWPRVLSLLEVLTFVSLFSGGLADALKDSDEPVPISGSEMFEKVLHEDLRALSSTGESEEPPAADELRDRMRQAAIRLLELSGIPPGPLPMLAERFDDSLVVYKSAFAHAMRSTLAPAAPVNDRVEESQTLSEYGNALQAMGIDWVTVHYVTRHSAPEAGADPIYVREGIPLSARMANLNQNGYLQVYERALAEYAQAFAEVVARKGRPVSIHLLKEGQSEASAMDEDVVGHHGSLTVHESLATAFARITSGTEAQAVPTAAEMAVLEAGDTQRDLPRAADAISDWKGKRLSVLQAAKIIRDSCRLTFLALRKEAEMADAGVTNSQRAEDVIRLPRVVVLVPAYVGENPVGGVAFVGKHEEIGTLEILSLGVIGRQLLTTLRLMEESEVDHRMKQEAVTNRFRDEFMSAMAHNIGNPLDLLRSATQGAIADLEGLAKECETKAASLKHPVEEAILRLQGVDGLVTTLRERTAKLMLGVGRKDLEGLLVLKRRAAASVSEFVDDIVFLHRRMFAEHSPPVELVVSQIPADWTMWVDKDTLLEVFVNLLTNAVRYARTRVEVSARKETPVTVTIRVHDDGPGVPTAIRRGLFEAGVADRDRIRAGHGFGLLFCRLAVRALGGSIRLAEDVDHGAAFDVTLPGEEPPEGENTNGEESSAV